jgi:nucleotide-binding universal stress UspA family protein
MTADLRLLVCVDGSRAALHAARLAFRLTAERAGAIRVVSVVAHDEMAQRLDARGGQERPAGQRFVEGARAVLDHVESLADDMDVVTAILQGEPLRAILADAREWQPDLILVGRAGRTGPGSPLVGSLAMHLVEFSDWPVVIVPAPRPS